MKSPFTRAELDTTNIQLETIYSNEKNQGFVCILWGDKAAQMTPKECREFAKHLMDYAAGAEQDEVFMEWSTETIGIELDKAIPMLQDLRRIRTKRGMNTPDE